MRIPKPGHQSPASQTTPRIDWPSRHSLCMPPVFHRLMHQASNILPLQARPSCPPGMLRSPLAVHVDIIPHSVSTGKPIPALITHPYKHRNHCYATRLRHPKTPLYRPMLSSSVLIPQLYSAVSEKMDTYLHNRPSLVLHGRYLPTTSSPRRLVRQTTEA